MPTYSQLWPKYAKQWDSMVVQRNFNAVAKKILANKNRYIVLEGRTGVPWYLIGLLHLREADLNFNTQLAQGDPLSRRSTHVPRGRGPFRTWEEGGYDALVVLKGWDKVQDWRLEKVLYYAELYNGWGYFNHGVPSAYLWAGSSVYRGGKYVADGVWSSTARDSQPGVAAVLKVLMEMDPSIKPDRESNVASNAVAGGAVVAGASAAANWMDWAPYILVGAVAVAIVGWLLVKYFKNRKGNI